MAASAWIRALWPAASGGTFENVCAVAQILKGKNCGDGVFRISVYPDSMPTYLELVKNGAVADIVSAGGIFRECFCGPCFGAGDTPANGEFSIPPHPPATSPTGKVPKPGEGQISAVALMDARSIAATAANGGVLTAASEILDEPLPTPAYHFDQEIYRKRVYKRLGQGRAGLCAEVWPQHQGLAGTARPVGGSAASRFPATSADPVTTTDELIPSGETSSYRSNPLRLAEFTLSRKTRPMWAVPRRSRRWMMPARQAPCRPRCRRSMMHWQLRCNGRRQGGQHRLCHLCQQARRRLRP